MADTRLQMLEKIKATPGGLNPVQRTEYEQLLREQQAAQPGPAATASTTDVVSMAQQLAAQLNQLRQPAIATLESTRPLIEEGFTAQQQSIEAGREPLKQRYQNLLAELTRRETQETETAGRIASRELGRRGIPLSSTSAQEFIGERVQPISQFFTGQRSEAETARTEGEQGINELLARLTAGRAGQQASLAQAIASIQGATAPEAISTALSLYQTQRQQEEAALNRAIQEAQLAEQQRQFDIAQAAQQPAPELKFADVLGGGYIYNPVTGEVVNTLADLRKTMGAGATAGAGSKYYNTPQGTSGGRYSLVG